MTLFNTQLISNQNINCFPLPPNPIQNNFLNSTILPETVENAPSKQILAQAHMNVVHNLQNYIKYAYPILLNSQISNIKKQQNNFHPSNKPTIISSKLENMLESKNEEIEIDTESNINSLFNYINDQNNTQMKESINDGPLDNETCNNSSTFASKTEMKAEIFSSETQMPPLPMTLRDLLSSGNGNKRLITQSEMTAALLTGINLGTEYLSKIMDFLLVNESKMDGAMLALQDLNVLNHTELAEHMHIRSITAEYDRGSIRYFHKEYVQD